MKDIPRFLEEMLLKQYGEDIAKQIISGYQKQRYVTLRVNTIKSSVKEIEDVLIKNNIEFEHISWNENALIIKNVREDRIKEMDIFRDGKIYLQSLSSMIPAVILEPKSQENILDMAAAPGGKTTQIAAITNNQCMITACEKNKIRADRLKYNLEKQGVRCTDVMLEDARKLSDFFSFDKILLDAPCSGSGTEGIFNKSFSKELIDRSSKVQTELLIKALKILKPGNEMVYSTCSILRQENEDVINSVLHKISAEIVPINIDENIPKLDTIINGTLCVAPNELYEGFFVAKIKKK